MSRWMVGLLISFYAFLPAAAGAEQGTLIIVGGGSIPDEVYARALALAGGAEANIAIFPQASELGDTGARTVERWKKAGAANAAAVGLKDGAAAVRAVEQASIPWFPGGDQNRLMKALEGTGILEAIQRKYREGGIIGGTSAGAAVMTSVMITGDADLKSITAGATKTAPGLGLLPDAVVDQHFLKRQRQSRLISLVLDRPELVGIGIDEQTAIFIAGKWLEVAGRGSVVIYDARRARVENRAEGQLAAGRYIRMHVLTAGMSWEFGRR